MLIATNNSMADEKDEKKIIMMRGRALGGIGMALMYQLTHIFGAR